MLFSALIFTIVMCLFAARADSASLTVLRAREHRQVHALWRWQGTARFFRRHPWLLRYGPEQQRWVARREARRAAVWVPILRRELAETRKALHPRPVVRYLSAWLCIHAHEGAWNANTGNGYYGGLQMDWSFMRAYGRALLKAKGTADHWTPLEQMLVAERAHAKRGFGPWPNTRRMCGV